MSQGGYHPYPRRFGGSAGSRLEVVQKSLAQQRGTAVDAGTEGTVAWIETMAFARAVVFDGWGTNDRLGHQWDPNRMTDMRARWETILTLRPGPTATDPERRTAVLRKFERFEAGAGRSELIGRLTEKLGDVYVDLEYIGPTIAGVTVPTAGYPWGSVVAGKPWSSNVAELIVKLQKPTGWSEAQFYEAVGGVRQALDDVVPAWVTYLWYRPSVDSANVNISDGPSEAEFWLDEDYNLDNHLFGS